MTSKSETHPLFNPVILEKICSFLPIQSLKNCRLTCKLWRHVSLACLRRLSKVVLVRGGKSDGGPNSFRSFLDFVLTLPPGEIPFENYFLDHWALNEKREKRLRAFWDVCGPSMKHLHLANVVFYEVETIRNFLYKWSPALESLNIQDCLFYTITSENSLEKFNDVVKVEDFDEPNLSYDYYDHVTVEQLKNVARDSKVSVVNTHLVEFTYDQLEEEEFPLAWEEVFTVFPNIKRLNIALTTPAEQTSKILNALDNVRDEKNIMGCLSNFRFIRNTKHNTKLDLQASHLYKISDMMCLPLTSLSLILSHDISVESVVNIVRQYSPILQYLCIHSQTEEDSQAPLQLFQFQKFPRLLELCVSKNILGGNLSLIDRTPKLKTLRVWFREEEFSWETLIDEEVLKSKAVQHSNPELNELSLGYNLSSPQSISLLCLWFKNLKVLKMALTDEIIRVVFRELKSLEEIAVFDRYLTDVGITGNPTSLSELTPWNGSSQREFSYIGDLKKLWKFTLTFRRYEGITDTSVYQGFMDVPELSSLLLTRTNIGLKALKDLYMKSTLVTMVTPSICKGTEMEYSE